MKRLLIVVMLMILLTGCSHNYNEEYYRQQVEDYDIELEIRVISFKNTHLENDERIVRVEYVEYYEQYQFKPIILYSFCINTKCELITQIKYLEIKGGI